MHLITGSHPSSTPDCIDTLLTLPVWADSWELWHTLAGAAADLSRLLPEDLPDEHRQTRFYVLLACGMWTEESWATSSQPVRQTTYVGVLQMATELAEWAFHVDVLRTVIA